MQNKSDELSQEMYHRIYRMIKRKVDPQYIAATLNLPLKMINNIVFRIKQGEFSDPSALIAKQEDHSVVDFLDVYLYAKTRYAIIQLVGALSKPHIYLVENELDKSIAASWKAVALRLTDVHAIDSDSCNFILSSFQKYQTAGRYLALLDPSPEIEPILSEHNMEDSVPIFGTERAFEEAAFSKKPLSAKAPAFKSNCFCVFSINTLFLWTCLLLILFLLTDLKG